MRITLRIIAIAIGALLLATACAPATGTGGSGGSGGGGSVNIEATEFKFAAPTTTFTRGQPIRFTVKNSGSVEHSWELMPRGEMDVSKALVAIPSSELRAGATASRQYIFQNAGNYEFACHLPGHYEAGMKLDVTVS